MGRSLDRDRTAVPFKSTQVCDKDACWAQNVFCSTSLGNVKVANMGGRMFVWIWSWRRLATTFGFTICRWYLDICKVFPRDNDVVGQAGSILGWCRFEIECGKNSFDHNKSSTTTVFDYLNWSRDQGEGKGIGSQMVGLHVIFSRFKKCSSGYWLSFAIGKSRLLCQQIDFSEPKYVHQKQTEILRRHRDTSCLFWSWAPMHPYCRYGQIWYPLPTYDPLRGWSSRRDLLAGSMARNSAYLESARARNGWGMPHENVGWNLRFSTMEICFLHHGPSIWTLGTWNIALATYWKRTRGTPSIELDKQIWTIFSN